ncbi:D-aspartate oxidase [Nymphon striatum]|nr:D-aspartate oxidase [Nymphon striatum]
MDSKYVQFLNNGGQIEKRTVKSLAEFAGKCDVVINCTGLRAKQLVGDNSIFGVRGQVFKVKAPWIKHFYYHNLNTYVIPGIDYVTIGGTRQLSEPANEINPFDSISIMERAVRLVPSLKNAEVAKQWVGLRPTRHPIRVEKEILKFGDREVKGSWHQFCSEEDQSTPYYFKTLSKPPAKPVVYTLMEKAETAAVSEKKPFIQFVGDQPVMLILLK